MNDDIRFILENALLAPSGDNNQPWHWVVRGNTLELWSRFSDEPLNSLYSNSSKNTSSAYLALGTAIENASIAGTARGYRTAISYFPDSSRPMLSAVLTLSKDARVQPDPLANVLSRRVTNRKPYSHKPLQPHERAKLLEAGRDEELGETKFIDDRTSINKLATLASLHDELMFGTKPLHDYIFSHINWTKSEDRRRRVGFYFPTLAAPPFTWGAMQLLRHWWIMRLGIALGLHRLIALEQRFVYRRAGAYGIVLARGDSPTDWMRVGRLVERIWLAATNAGLSLQPLTGVIFLTIGSGTEEGKRTFTLDERNRLKEARENIARIFGAQGKTLAFMFRIGRAKPPSAHTSRRPFEQMVDIVNQSGA